MKKQNCFLLLALLSFSVISISFIVPNAPEPAENTAGKVFKLFYIDNSKPGVSSAMLDYIYEETDSLADNPFLLYMSNSNEPIYTKNAVQVKTQLAKLSEERFSFPDCIYDKQSVMRILKNDNLSNLTGMKIYFILTENYLKELIKVKPAYLLRFLPSELGLLTNTSSEKIEVNICYSLMPGSQNQAEFKNLAETMNFYNTGKYKSLIKYRIIQK